MYTSTRKNTFTLVTLQSFSNSGAISAEKMQVENREIYRRLYDWGYALHPQSYSWCCTSNAETWQGYVPVKSKLQHPSRATPRAFEFLENFWKIPPSRGQKAVQMPHHRSIPGDQMLPPPANFSVVSMPRKLCM